MSVKWSMQTSNQEAFRRAGGRRRYNFARQIRANQRRLQVLQLTRLGMTKAEIARALGVHRSQITRDFQRPEWSYLFYLGVMKDMERKMARIFKK